MATRKRSKDNASDGIPRSEREAFVYCERLNEYIKAHKGQYLRGENGSFHLILDGTRIPLSYDRDNHNIANLMLEACGVSTLSQGAQAAIQRLQVTAHRTASAMTFRRFSALSPGRERLYIPIHGGQLLAISSTGISSVPNGDNEDKFWVEHPCGQPLNWQSGGNSCGLAPFERLVVETQACRAPAMRWLVAMHEAFFPYVRDLCKARFLLVHIGGTQQGKTSGAQRFTILHALGDVKGDYSVAALASLGDVGLLVMDNKEQANFTQELIDHCLFLATGAERGRSLTDGQLRKTSARPVAVITSIEGAWKSELQARCVEVPYEINGGKKSREDIEDEISVHRHEMLSAMIPVFQAWLRLRAAGIKAFWTECPLPNFERHITVLAELLRAYAEVASKEKGWAEAIIAEWVQSLNRHAADAEDDLEYPLLQLLRNAAEGGHIVAEAGVEYGGKSGTLHVTEAAALLDALRRSGPRDIALPKNAAGLSRRLRSARFRAIKFLDGELAPKLPQLRRAARKRPIGFFEADDADGSMTV